MRSIFLASCIALGTLSSTHVLPARAEVDVRVPGVAIETGRDHLADRRELVRRDEHCDRDRDHCRR